MPPLGGCVAGRFRAALASRRSPGSGGRKSETSYTLSPKKTGRGAGAARTLSVCSARRRRAGISVFDESEGGMHDSRSTDLRDCDQADDDGEGDQHCREHFVGVAICAEIVRKRNDREEQRDCAEKCCYSVRLPVAGSRGSSTVNAAIATATQSPLRSSSATATVCIVVLETSRSGPAEPLRAQSSIR